MYFNGECENLLIPTKLASTGHKYSFLGELSQELSWNATFESKRAESNSVYVQCLQSGRVLYIRNVPPFKGSDSLILKIAEPFGKIKRYFLHRLRNEVM